MEESGCAPEGGVMRISEDGLQIQIKSLKT